MKSLPLALWRRAGGPICLGYDLPMVSSASGHEPRGLRKSRGFGTAANTEDDSISIPGTKILAI
jgi:hypothetical protein